jgi:hypothetical protein
MSIDEGLLASEVTTTRRWFGGRRDVMEGVVSEGVDVEAEEEGNGEGERWFGAVVLDHAARRPRIFVLDTGDSTVTEVMMPLAGMRMVTGISGGFGVTAVDDCVWCMDPKSVVAGGVG